MKTLLTAILGVAFAAGSLTAHANIITITDTAATVECTAGLTDPACQGFTGGSPDASGEPTALGTLSSTMADIYDIIGSEAAETDALNTLAGTTLLSTDAVQIDAGGVDSASFSTDALYFAIKSGFGTTFFKNEEEDLTLDVEYEKNGTRAGGISHFTYWGGTGTVDVPEPGTLILLSLGLLGLASGRRLRMTG